jgi:hypothetical protein
MLRQGISSVPPYQICNRAAAPHDQRLLLRRHEVITDEKSAQWKDPAYADPKNFLIEIYVFFI